MSTFDSLLSFYAGGMARALWHVTIVSLGVLPALYLARRSAPALRLSLCAVMLLTLAAPIARSPIGAVEDRPPFVAALEFGPRSVLTGNAPGAAPRPQDSPEDASSATASPAPRTDSPDTAGHEGTALDWRLVALCVHALGVLGFALALIREMRGLARMVARSKPARPEHEARLRDVARRMGLARAPKLRLLDRGSPMCFGIRRPTILIPDGLGSDELEIVLLHETAHLRHRDPIWNAAQLGLTALWWFHPATWLLGLEQRRAQEDRADDAVLRHTEPGRYGDSLLSVLRDASRSTPSRLALSMARGGEHALARRLRRIFDSRTRRRMPMAQLMIPAILALLLTPISGTSQVDRQDGFNAPEVEPPSALATPADPGSLDDAMRWLAEHPSTTLEEHGLVLLAFLGSGQTSEVGPQRKMVAKLHDQVAQARAELTGTPSPGEAVASLALIESFVLTSQAKRDAELAQRVADRMARCAQAEDLDVETAFWASFALISARLAELKVDDEDLAKLIRKVPLGQQEGAARWDAATTSAASVMLHFLAGGKPDDPALRPAVETALGSLARPVLSTQDVQRVQLASLAMYQVGGDTWKAWNSGPVKRLAARVREDGSFPALDDDSQVTNTALAALTLEVAYRYGRLVR